VTGRRNGAPCAVIAWSSGKDSAFALHEVRRAGRLDIVGILTTVTDPYARVSMHGVRETILDAQAASLGLPATKVRIPAECTDETYASGMGHAVAVLREAGVSHMIFGDLFLEDVRDYRIAMLSGTGIEPVFPLWGRDTAKLAREMIGCGIEARLTCVDPRVVDPSLAGRRFDRALLDCLPETADPCGENGEFHTLVTSGPMFARPIAVTSGKTVMRDGFVFADGLRRMPYPGGIQGAAEDQ
jgi:uncharacterized protein (TIGR00290 family)